MLLQVAILLLGAVLLIPLAKHLGLGAVLGYLIAGVALGPWGLGLIQDVGAILHFGEFGVILLLFVIGLELKPSRLWVLRRPIFGLGGLQVVVTALAITGLALAFGLAWKAAFVVGLAVAMSSTAMVLQTLAERNQLPDRHGRDAFAILLFQDIAVIPVLAVLPMLGQGRPEIEPVDILRAAAAILGVVLAGRVLVRPLFSLIARLGSRETFTAAALLVVVATTLLMEWVGLSASLGAFLAGVVLADSEFRHELEADLEPFKGLLLGLFFMAVGMGANLGLLAKAPLLVVGLAVLILGVKTAVLLVIARALGRPSGSARKLAIALAQGGEFAFVIFQLARQETVLEAATLDVLTVAVTLSMVLWPLVFVLEERFLAPRLDSTPRRPFDHPVDHGHPVVIAGLGRVGQIAARILAVRRIPFTVLEADPEQVDFLRRFGNEVYYGDASRLDMLEAAGVGRARVFVLAIDDVEASLKTAALLRKHYPKLPVIARARNRFHAYKLMDLGIDTPIRETLHSSLAMAESLLKSLGLSAVEAASTIERFAEHDAASLRRQHAVYEDEARLVESIHQARDELRSLFDQDAHSEKAAPGGAPERAHPA